MASPRIASSLAAMALCAIAAGATADDGDLSRQDTLARGRAALRAMDCARCHGRDYTGWTAPSLVAAVRDTPRERFEHFVLEGDITRGMPGYRSQPLVVAELDAMYAYLCAKAEPAGPAMPAATISRRADEPRSDRCRPVGATKPVAASCE
ncbi:MAG: c-type cytochrome [Betaproteobacteria bacterium]